MEASALRQAMAESNAAWKDTSVYRELQKERAVDDFTRGMERLLLVWLIAFFAVGGIVGIIGDWLFQHIHISISWVC